ncbi:MAG: hypothetical protein LRZ85_08420 [Alphaproteobacteria bacterium]|nr:hypothetical protein [Alphaproteobacteria bacterium]
MSDVAHIAVAEDEKGNPVTTAEVLEHATATPEGMKIFDAIGKMLTRENAERLAPLLAIVYPKAAIYLVGYALRNVPYHAYKAAVADTSEERAEQLRAIFSSAADGLRNSGPLVKPTLWAGLHLPKFLQSIGDLFVKDAIKYGVESFSDKKKWASMREFFESVQNDPKAFLKVFDDLASYFGDTSNTVVTFAAVAIHAKFGSKGTLVLKELAQRGFFEALIKGDTKTADEIKKQVPDGVKVANALEDIRVNEETPDQRAKRDYEEAWLNQLVIPGA